MGKADCTHQCHLQCHVKYKTLRGGCFVLINKWCYPQSAFTHDPGPMILLYEPPIPCLLASHSSEVYNLNGIGPRRI